jgi:hypothetical protein
MLESQPENQPQLSIPSIYDKVNFGSKRNEMQKKALNFAGLSRIRLIIIGLSLNLKRADNLITL